MKIYVDADAIPRVLKDVLIKVAERVKCHCYFVAAYPPRLPDSMVVQGVGAGDGFDAADNWIAEQVEKNDLVITADIPLAHRVITKEGAVLNLKGSFFTPANITHALAMRNLMDELRVSGEITGGPAPFSDKQRIAFVNALNTYIQRHFK